MPNIAKFDNLPTIKRTGIIFRPGNFGAKGVYTESDIDAMAGDAPLPVNLEHRQSLLDGKLGHLTRRFSGYDDSGNKVLMGEWNEPEPLALLLGDTTRKASIEIDMATKQPVGLALTHLPHIQDCALFSAYAKFSNGDKEQIKPVATFAYESASERDAIPDEDYGDATNKLFPVRTQQEFREAMRELAYADDPTAVKTRILEIAARKGLNVNDYEWPLYQTTGVSRPLGTAMYSQENTVMPTAAELAAQAAAEHPKPTLIEQVKALFTGAKPEELDAVETALTSAKTGKTPNEIALETKLAQFTADAEAQRVAGIKASAEAEANRLIEEKKILPADKEAVVAAFSAAAEIDANLPELACFTADNAAPAEFKLTDHLKGVYAKLPEHNKTEEEAGSIDPKLIAAFDQNQTVVTDKNTGETLAVVDGVLKAQNSGVKEALTGKKAEVK